MNKFVSRGVPPKTPSWLIFKGRAWHIKEKGKLEKGNLVAGSSLTRGRDVHIIEFTCTSQHACTLTDVFVDDRGSVSFKSCFMKKCFQGNVDVSALQERLSTQEPVCIPVLSLGCPSKEPHRPAGGKPASTNSS